MSYFTINAFFVDCSLHTTPLFEKQIPRLLHPFLLHLTTPSSFSLQIITITMSLPVEWIQKFDTGFNNRFFMVRHGQSEANVSDTVSSIYYVSIPNHGLTTKGIEQACDAAGTFYNYATKHQPTVDILGSPVVNSKNTTPTLENLDQCIFVASDFKRAYETAHYMKESLVYKLNQTNLAKKFDLMQLQEEDEQQPDQGKPTEEDQNNQTKDKIVAPQEHEPPSSPRHGRNASIDMSSCSKKSRRFAFPIPPAPTPQLYTNPALRERYFGAFEGAPSGDSYNQVWAKDAEENPAATPFGCESIQSVVDRTIDLILELDRTWKNKMIVLVSHGDVAQIVLSVLAAIDPCHHRTLPHMENCDVRELLLVRGQVNDFVVVEEEDLFTPKPENINIASE